MHGLAGGDNRGFSVGRPWLTRWWAHSRCLLASRVSAWGGDIPRNYLPTQVRPGTTDRMHHARAAVAPLNGEEPHGVFCVGLPTEQCGHA